MGTKFARFRRHADHIHLNLESPNDGLIYRGEIGDQKDIRFHLIRKDNDEISPSYKKLHKRLVSLRAKSLENLERKLNKVMISEGYMKLVGSSWDYRFSREVKE